MNLVVKTIKVDKFKFVESINLEKKDKNEFINRLMDWFDSKYEYITFAIGKEDEVSDQDDQ
jgi:hypothetical protein